MKYDKTFLRNKFLLLRKKKSNLVKKFNYNLIFSLIKKHFDKEKITIAAYYPVNYEVNILNFLKIASKKEMKIALPVIKPKNRMCFKTWPFEQPLYVNNLGILEPKKNNMEANPDLILVPLVAFDSKLNRIGYGKGYYDRKLSEIKKNKKNTISVGVAYSFQKCKVIPAKKHDYKLDYIFTERGIITSN